MKKVLLALCVTSIRLFQLLVSGLVLEIGKSIKNKKAANIIEEINNTVSKWKKFADEVNVSPKFRDEIAKTLIRLK